MSLKKAFDQLKNAVGDLTSIEVQTYVGEIDVVVDGVTGSTSFEDSLKNAKQDGKIALSLVTKPSLPSWSGCRESWVGKSLEFVRPMT